jgi:hypothetical protein
MSIPIDEWPHVGCTPFTYANPTNFTLNVVDNSSVTVNHNESTAHNAFVMPARVHRLTEHGFKTRPAMQYTNEIAPPAAKRNKLVIPHSSMGVMPRFKPFKVPEPPPVPSGGGGGGGGGGGENISVVFRPRDEITSTRLAKQNNVLESEQLQEAESDVDNKPGQLPNENSPPKVASTILRGDAREARAQAAQDRANAAQANRRALETDGSDEVVEAQAGANRQALETGGGDEDEEQVGANQQTGADRQAPETGGGDDGVEQLASALVTQVADAFNGRNNNRDEAIINSGSPLRGGAAPGSHETSSSIPGGGAAPGSHEPSSSIPRGGASSVAPSGGRQGGRMGGRQGGRGGRELHLGTPVTPGTAAGRRAAGLAQQQVSDAPRGPAVRGTTSANGRSRYASSAMADADTNILQSSFSRRGRG